MSTVLLLHRLDSEARRSPEMVELGRYLAGQARQAFGDLQIQTWDDELPAEPGTDVERVLLVDGAGVLTTAASLRSMARALGGGAPLAVPGAVASLPELAEEPVYTLRGFEGLEARALAGEVQPAGRDSHLPIALIPTATLRLRAAEIGWREALTSPAAFVDEIRGQRLTGLHHQFIDYYGEVRKDVLPYLPRAAGDVLEVGCGRGLTGAFLQERLGCRVTGVELNAAVAEDARRRLHRVLVGDIESLEIDGSFDAVVATELFEHLRYPMRFVERARRLLRPGGRIVLSVPNVGHWSVTEDLLAGRWDYLPIGLLCFTHFRFFTQATLEEWLSREGWSFRILPQTTELPERFGELPPSFEVDRESLRTKGFYVLIEAA